MKGILASVTCLCLLLLQAYLVFNKVGKAGENEHNRRNTGIVFVKTHKTGGSTVSQILLRGALKRGYTVAQPRGAVQTIGRLQRENLIPLPHGKQHYDMVAHHFVYNREDVEELFGQDRFVFTILRDPVEVFVSGMLFLDIPLRMVPQQSGHPFSELDSKTVAYLNFLEQNQDQALWEWNLMCRDLGWTKDRDIEEFVVSIEQDFDLIMIQEHFVASLLLLQQQLGWQDKDMMYLEENRKGRVNHESYGPLLSPTTIDRINAANSCDVQLYQHFNSIMLRFRPVPATAVQKFNDKLNSAYAQCICGTSKKGLFGSQSYIPCGNEQECKDLITDSLALTNIIAKVQLIEISA